MIYINRRILNSHTTGVQRYLESILNTEVFSNLNFQFEDSHRNGIKGHLWEQFCLPLKLTGNDVLWSPSNTGPLFCKARHVLTIHDFSAIEHPEWVSAQFHFLYKNLLPRLVKKVEHIITESEFTKSKILEYCQVSENKITIIPLGVDERFKPIQKYNDLNNLRNKYNLKEKRYVLSVSSIEPRKNIKSILESWSKLVNKIDDDIWLVVVGKENRKVFSDVGISVIPPRVQFTGFVDDDLLPLLYAGAEAFIYMPFYEGFGLPPLEAMASGVPVITSNITAVPEVVRDAAVLADPYDINDITDKLSQVLSSEILRANYIARGLKRACDFSWNITAEKIYSILTY